MLLHDLLGGGSLGTTGLDDPAPEGAAAGSGDGFEIRGDPDVEVCSITHDSREVARDALFCCIPGGTTDGHEYVAAARAGGASAFLVERFVDVDGTQVRVPSVRRAIGPIAARFSGDPSRALTVLGVTGTNGKTTTCYFLEAIAVAAGKRAGVIGTVETRYGDVHEGLRHTTPEATELQALFARMRAAEVDTVAMEVSSHALDQYRVDGTRFAATCFTNLSQDHLDYHGTLDAYLAAKARLFARAFTDRAAINVATPVGRELAAGARERGLVVITFVLADDADDADREAPAADVEARAVELGARGSRFVLHDHRDASSAPVEIALPGRFNVENALAAATTALLRGDSMETVTAGLSRPIVVPGRMERVDNDRGVEVIVDYAHTPEALRQALAASRAIAGESGRVIVVFGCGGDRDREKRPQMGAATRVADVAVLTSDNPRSERAAAIAEDVIAGVGDDDDRLVVELDRRTAIRDALLVAQPGDVVLIAGKGHEQGQTANGKTLPFDDRVVAREELEALRCA
ncbi:MAG TPA: UDP-N-acetylmuramoyl-L-alanyl-D-glutamate--2,6-diaminopimelate ligase [Acidimicrobiia bacterium]|nr:UDP-N-acetylmuramoyl-L-alanyl-D-glutamate--2,6-diaminopimelate ligase [Acidimicrobiia bacterium]